MFNPIYFWILQVPFHWTYIQSDLLVEFPIISPLFTPSVIQYPITFSFQYAFSLHIIHTATGLNIFDSINTSKDCIGSQIEEFSTSLLFFFFCLSLVSPSTNQLKCVRFGNAFFTESCNSWHIFLSTENNFPLVNSILLVVYDIPILL